MPPTLQFLPNPRQLHLGEGVFRLPETALILLDAPQPQLLRSAAGRIQKALYTAGFGHWAQAASRAVPDENVGLTLRVAPERAPHPQGYRLHVQESGVTVEGHDPAGVFYGVCTLIQLLEQSGAELPLLEINDWPDIPARGVMIDISRDKVYRMDYLFTLVDMLAGWKYNQLQFNNEHPFTYYNHPTVWAKASPVSGDEIMALDEYCRERFIELVPNQNSFGHMERWLMHEPYAELAEMYDEVETSGSSRRMKDNVTTLAPEHPGSLALITSLYDELLPHFTSKMFNIGCDETFELGHGASKAISEERGKGRVYLDFLLRLYADVSRRGYTIQFWGDIINNHHPELVAELPRDVIALNWGYEANHPFDVESERFANSGVPFYVCPGTSSWTTIAGRTDNALGNLRNAAENGVKYGAIGFLNTDWGDRGHWQVPPVSWLGFAAGAAYSWALEANRDLDVAAALSRFAFGDPSGAMGQAVYDLGNAYQWIGVPIGNGSALFWAFQLPLERAAGYDVSAEAVEATLAGIDSAAARIEQASMDRPDADLIRREFRLAARMLRHGALRIKLGTQGGAELRDQLAADLDGLVEEFQAVWLERARPGGLEDSLARFEQARADYAARQESPAA